uniref:BED-type domain-containing protein n=1 Tax=Leptobrachium leishanense TaxID=445787 RepID=A0A8C5MB93_9ANUR
MTNRSTSQSKASDVRAAQVQSAVVSKHTSRNSAVWEFFKKCAADPTVAICNLCQMRLKRGKDTGRLGTTCLRRHMNTCHTSRWRKTLRRSSSSTCVSTPTVCPAMSLPKTPTDRDDATVMDVPGPSSQCDSIPIKLKIYAVRLRCPSCCSVRKNIVPTIPKQCLNASLAKLLALQLLPFQLVDSAPFREFAEYAVPQWHVPKRHYFSRKAIPALYQHVEDNVIESLGKAVSSKVHVTLDTWSSKHRQGRYISFTAHWVTLIAAERDPRRGSVLELVHPPHLQKAACMRSVCSTTTSPSSSFCVSGEVAVKPTPDRGYAMAQAKRCHTVLELVCLGDRSHTGPEIKSALQGQVQRWLTPRQHQLGMIVCDNGSNLLSALRLGKLTHVPCLAHVLNLVVQRFLTKYPGLPELLIQARKVCSHFRRSFPASVRLAEIQREFHLPTNRLICDMPTRWNSILAMLQYLHKQQRAINEYLCEYGTRTGSGQLGSPPQWLMIKDACTVLSPFEEATRMVSRDSACISDTIPLVFLLEHTLQGIIDVALQAEQREEEEAFPSSEGPSLSADSIPAGPPQIRQEEDEEYLSSGGIEGGDSSREGFVCPETQGLVRGWEEEVHDGVILLIDQEDSEANATSNLRCMGSLIMQSLLKDPRIRAIKERDHYWLATLLDPRYKGKIAELILPAQREHRMKKLEDALKRHLCNTFPGTGRLPSDDTRASEAVDDQRNSGEGRGRLTDAFLIFFSPHCPGTSNVGTHCQRLHHMVQDYLGARADLDTFPEDNPLVYWVLRLDHWPEFSQYAMQLLGCPSSSVLSERTFSAAGGFVTDKRVRLSTDSVDRLTFIKMNQSWISSYQSPDADVTE